MSDFPCKKPECTGKLKLTPILPCQPGFIEPTKDEKREIIYTALADGDLTIDQFNKFIARC